MDLIYKGSLRKEQKKWYKWKSILIHFVAQRYEYAPYCMCCNSG